MSRPTRDCAEISDPALHRCGEPDDTTLRQADRVPGSTGGSRPVAPLFTDPEDGPRHPAIIALAIGMVIITGLSVLGLLVVAAVQIWKAVVR